MDTTAKQGGGSGFHSVEFMIRSNDELVYKKNVLLTKPRALSKAIAEVLIVDVRNIEVYQLIASDEGIKVGFSVYSYNFQMETLYKNELKLAYLISDHWKVKQFTKIKDLRPVNVSNDFDEDETPSTGDSNAESVGATTHKKTLTDLTLVPLDKMQTLGVQKVKDNDPELMNLRRGALTTITEYKWNAEEYMIQLKTKYNINIQAGMEDDMKSNLLWSKRANNIQKLLDDRHSLLKSKRIINVQPKLEEIKRLTIEIDGGDDEKEESEIQLDEIWSQANSKYNARRQQTVDGIFDLKKVISSVKSPELLSPTSVSVYDRLHSRVQSTIQENLNVFEMINPSKKYVITINSADSQGFTLKAAAHGYNTKIVKCETERIKSLQAKGIKLGMIISDINKQSVLGLPFDAIQKQLEDNSYPLKLSFMNADNVSIRFEMVLNAASLIYGALKNGFDEANIFTFLDAEGMSKLEIRTAVGLECEYSELLKHGNDDNALYSLFMESQFATKDKIKIQPTKPQMSSPSSIKSFAKRLSMRMHSPKTPTLARTESESHDSDPEIDDEFDHRMKAMMNHINNSKNNKNSQSVSAFNKITRRVSALFTPKSALTQKKNLQMTLTDHNSADNDEHKSNRKVKFDDKIHGDSIENKMISRLKGIKSQNDNGRIDDDCYTQEHLQTFLDEMKLEFDEHQMKDVMIELMDSDFGYAYGDHILSDTSIEEFIEFGGTSEAGKILLSTIRDALV